MRMQIKSNVSKFFCDRVLSFLNLLFSRIFFFDSCGVVEFVIFKNFIIR